MTVTGKLMRGVQGVRDTQGLERTAYARVAMALLAGAGLPIVGGCQYTKDSYLDPSVAGRWEHTATVVPILDRIAAIEDEAQDIVEYSDPVGEDLVPQAMQYRLGAGDILRVSLWDLVQIGTSEDFEVTIDQRGFIELPQVGRVNLGGQTVESGIELIKERMTRLVAKPLANISVLAARQATYTLLGSLEQPGTYQIPRPDYRLLEAITSGGAVFASEQSVEYVYVIRQIPLAPSLTGASPTGNAGGASAGTNGRSGNGATGGNAPDATTPPTGDDILKLIDDVAGPEGSGATRPDGGASPGMFEQDAPPPAIDLPDARGGGASGPSTPWVFVDGKWVEVARGRETGADGASVDTLLAQRVIRISYPELLNGKASANIIIRSGDVVRVPAARSGLIYIGGEVQRPGPIQIPDTGPITLTRAIDSAGGLSEIAVPERIELTRMVGTDRQATIMLDGRAIFERTQPDVLLKNNDHINVGTTFWALPLAVFRNGLRASYGFGFVLDRNISNDLFGPPPVNQFGG